MCESKSQLTAIVSDKENIPISSQKSTVAPLLIIYFKREREFVTVFLLASVGCLFSLALGFRTTSAKWARHGTTTS